jgi:hypothetical protein
VADVQQTAPMLREEREDRVSEAKPSSASGDRKPGEPKRIPMQPSRNQKQRSRLKQPADSTNAVPPAAPPAPAPPAAPPAAPEAEPLIRKMRLKRSGQMREDIFLPDDAQPPKPEEEY